MGNCISCLCLSYRRRRLINPTNPIPIIATIDGSGTTTR